MGVIQNITKKILSPVINSAVDSRLREELAKGDLSTPPKAYDVPTGAFYGYPFSGGTNRKDVGSMTFEALRQFSVVYDVARACINQRKRQIDNLDWNIVPIDETDDGAKHEANIEMLREFFLEPVHNTDFKMFIDKIIEDLMVFDAIVLWKDKLFKGDIAELMPVDAATIRIKITQDGTLPEPPEAAFQQIIKGTVYGEYSTDEMIYKMMNPRNNTPYGLSPLESLMIGVDSALRSQLYNASILAEGSVPEGFFALPDDWSAEQIKDYQMWFDAMMAGNPKFQSRIKFMPGGKGVGYMPTKKPEDMKFIEFEKWLLIKTCAMFDVQPQDIGFIENVNYSNSQTQQQLGSQRGLVPTAKFIKRIFDEIIRKDFGIKDLEFEWQGLQATDEDFELRRDEIMLRAGAYTIDEWRAKQGLTPFNLEASKKPMIFASTGPVLLESITEDSGEIEDPMVPGFETEEEDEETADDDTETGVKDNEESELEEVMKWETKCLKRIRQGKVLPEFKTNKIEEAVQNLIQARLTLAKTKDDVRAAFKPIKESLRERVILGKALEVQGEISKLRVRKNANA